MSLIKILFLTAIFGHLLCGYCDCLITYIPSGKRFDVKAMSNNAKMRDIFEQMPLKKPVLSMVLGCLALGGTINWSAAVMFAAFLLLV